MTRALFICVLAALFGCATRTPATSNPLLISLEQQVRQQQFMEAAADLHRLPTLSPDVLAWLTAKAEAGIPPLQYELSHRIWSADPNGALRWYARGYVGRSLDFSQCSDRPRNPVYLVMSGMYSSLRDKALEVSKPYANAIEDAIRWNEQRLNPPGPQWICGRMLLPEAQRQQAKQSQLTEIRDGVARLRAK